MIVLIAGCAPETLEPRSELLGPGLEASTPPPSFFPEPVPGLPPAAVLSGAPDLGFARQVWVVPDVTGDGLHDLIVGSDLDPRGGGHGLLITAPLAGGVGTDKVGAALVGDHDEGLVAHAGDTDRDGVGDLWWGTTLFRGPIAGSLGDLDAAARVDPGHDAAVAGGFDADLDGWLDVAVGHWEPGFTIVYGPFDGVVDLAGVTTVEGAPIHDYGLLTALGEVNRPGEVVLVAGNVAAFEVSGPRGRALRPRDAFATFDGGDRWLERLPDADGDGLTDVLHKWQPLTGPVAGDPSHEDVLSFVDQTAAHAVEDVTGDGLGDLVVEIVPDDEPAIARWYVVPGTTRGVALDPDEHGVLLAPIPQVNPWDERAEPYQPRFRSGDLDGDGIAELVAHQQNDGDRPGESGWVWIYSGRDLAEASR